MMKKTYNEAPRAELIIVRFEENFLEASNNYGQKGAAGGDIGEGNEYDL